MIARMLAGLAAVLIALPALAADPFYKGKTVTIITSTGAGGTYDTIARAVSRHMPRHLAGEPTMIVQNMPGGGHMLATNHMYNVAPKDGTKIATIHNAVPLHQVLGGRGARFDVAKFNWLGSTGPDNSGVIVWHTAKVKTYEDLLEKEAILGGTGPGSGIVIFPTVMNAVLGTKFKIVIGYKSSEEINIAMERGEVEARTFGLTSIFSQHRDWITENKIRFLAQVGYKRDKRLPDVPLLTELAKTDEARQILRLVASPTALGRPYIAPPGLPAERVAMLRKAFLATLNDKAFGAEMDKFKITVEPTSGEEVTEIVQATLDTSPEAAAKAKAVMPERKRGKKGKKAK